MDIQELDELKNLILMEKYLVHGKLNTADCVIGFSFGYRIVDRIIFPGKSNEQIAKYIESNLSGYPSILQFEIDMALKRTKSTYVIRKSRNQAGYLSSYEVALQAKEYMDSKGWKRAIIITHPGMVARNDYLCTSIGIETITPPGLEIIEYDSLSEQPWTRNSKVWIEKELNTIDEKNTKNMLKRPLINA